MSGLELVGVVGLILAVALCLHAIKARRATEEQCHMVAAPACESKCLYAEAVGAPEWARCADDLGCRAEWPEAVL